ncbi:MAG: S8 family serine peptidase [Coriobacteriales bacterium]|nr:S8 family serine peptidase [Coriobacteriales bacterium]
MRLMRSRVTSSLLVLVVAAAAVGLLVLGLRAAAPRGERPTADPIVVGTADPATPKAATASELAGPVRDTSRPKAVPKLLVAKLASGSTLPEVAEAAGVPTTSVRSLGDGLAEIRVPEGTTEARVIAKLNRSRDVAYAERVLVRYLAYSPPSYATPNDPSWTASNLYAGKSWATRSWWLKGGGLNMEAAWPAGLTGTTPNATGLRAAGSSKRVAVIDSGFYLNHEDRSASTIVGRYDFMDSWDGVSLSSIKTDTNVTPITIVNAHWFDPAEPAHGTAVAGEIAAVSKNAVGTTGASWDSQVYVYKVMGRASRNIDADGNGTVDFPAGYPLMIDPQIAKAIRKAADDGCKVINLSLGAPGYSQTLNDAVQYARSKGAIVVAAMGNDGDQLTSSTAFYPAANTGVVGIGSNEINDTTGLLERSVWSSTSGSNYGYGLDLYAPGSYVWGLSNPTVDVDGGSSEFTTGYGWWTGTSMATPAASAGLAFLWRAAPNLTAQDIINYAVGSSKDVHVSDSSALEPKGGFDVAAAYAAIVADYPFLGAPTLTQPPVVPSSAATPSWTAAPGTDVRYTVTLDGVVKSSGASATSANFTGLAEGEHTLTVQPTSSYNWYGPASSVTQTFTVNAISPVISTFAHGNGYLTWAHNESKVPHTVRLSIEGGPTTDVADADYDLSGLASGSHEATLTVIDAAGRSASRHLAFTLDPSLHSDAPSLALAPETITYGSYAKMTASGVTSGTASSLGGFVAFEVSADGVTWRRLSSVETTSATASYSHKFSSNYYVRAVVPGQAPSPSRRVLVKATLTTPSLSSTPRRATYSTVSGRISPRHTAGSSPIQVLIQRKVSGTWRTSVRTSAKTSDGYAWKYSWKPSATGSYRIRASHADAGHVASYSAYRYVTVR